MAQAVKDSRTWSDKTKTPDQIDELNLQIRAHGVKMAETDAGKKKIFENILEVFAKVDLEKRGSLCFDEYKNFNAEHAKYHKEVTEGYWVLKDEEHKALFDFISEKYGEYGRMSF